MATKYVLFRREFRHGKVVKSLKPLPSKVNVKMQPFPLFGSGYLAGEFPGGTTTVEGVPVAAEVRALWRGPAGHPADGAVCGSAQSGASGTWIIANLNENLRYDVVGRKDGFNDVIVSNVKPTSMVEITYAGAVVENETFTGASGYLELVGGLPPYTASVVEPLPTGMFPVVNGRQLIIDGTTEDDEVASFDVKVTSSNGAEKIIPLQLVVGFKAPANFKAETVVVDDVFSVSLTWEVTNSTQQIKVYRSETPFDLDDLPEPIATLSGTSTTYTDDDVIEDDHFYYMVTAVCGQYELRSSVIAEDVREGDPHWDKVVILLPFDGDISDEAGMPWRMMGGAEVVPSSESFTGTELYLSSAASSYILTGNNETLHLPYGTPWVFEGFHTPLAGGGQEILMSKRGASSGWEFRCDQGELYAVAAAGNDWGDPIEYFPASDITGRRFFQFRMDEDGTCEIYLNGLLHKQYPPESTKPFLTNNTSVTVGSSPNGPSPRYLNGFLDQLRFTVGASRPSVPPTAAFPSTSPTELTVINPRAEDNTAGWTVTAGTLIIHDAGDTNPVRMNFMGRSPNLYAHQDVEIPESLWAHVDSGLALARLQYLFGGWSGDADSGEVGITCLSASSTELGTHWSGLESLTSTTPLTFRIFKVDIPVGTRKIRVRMHGQRFSGQDLNAHWTDFRLFVDAS